MQDSVIRITHLIGNAVLSSLFVGFKYRCAGAVKITNIGNVRLTSITLSGQVNQSSCNPPLASLQLAAGAHVVCDALHATTTEDFQTGSKTLEVSSTATPLGNQNLPTFSKTSASLTVTLPSRKTATLAVTAAPPATPVAAAGGCAQGCLENY